MSYAATKDGWGRDEPIGVGFWWSRDSENAKYPRVEHFVDPSWDPRERGAVLRYIERPSHRVQAYRGWSTCRICGAHNGSADVSDRTYVWPSGFAHYIRAHAVKPPQEFVDHALLGVVL